ncbi:periplasmic heavy metal sensor [Hydrogenophaga borbori]|uniref:periplasmic heavy metal sensor n=1 Tax=Hydrogenophaga borbori TaxID=2294117 RepID=UPI00301CE070
MNEATHAKFATQGVCALCLTLAMAASASAQHMHGPSSHGQSAHEQPAHGHHSSGAPAASGHGQGAHQSSPYAGMQDRSIKALSAQQMADLRAGKGMSFALPAELNGYPGPSHTLELAEPLRLNPEQRARTQALFEQMQREAGEAGQALIAAERELDALFRNKQATPELLSAAVGKAADAQGAVRETHLRYHLKMMEVLSVDQVAAYQRLRGY